MPEFEVTLWFSEMIYGKAYTRIKAPNKEEARTKFNKELEEGKEFEMEWEYKVKGSSDLVHDYDEVSLTEINVEAN